MGLPMGGGGGVVNSESVPEDSQPTGRGGKKSRALALVKHTLALNVATSSWSSASSSEMRTCSCDLTALTPAAPWLSSFSSVVSCKAREGATLRERGPLRNLAGQRISLLQSSVTGRAEWAAVCKKKMEWNGNGIDAHQLNTKYQKFGLNKL